MRDGFGKTEAHGGCGNEERGMRDGFGKTEAHGGWGNEEAICGLGLAKMGKKGLERRDHKSFGRKTALVSTKKRTFARNFKMWTDLGCLQPQ